METKILVITPIKHINGLEKKLKSFGKLDIYDDPTEKFIKEIIQNYNIIYTNPNKSKVYLGKKLLDKAVNLKVIATASTGTNHIDVDYAKRKKIKVLSLTKDLKTIRKISSTAEHAFCLTLASIRNLIPSIYSVRKGYWDYTKYVGRQMDYLKVGIVGYGRLGKFYAKYCRAFNTGISVYDPYKTIKTKYINQLNSLDNLLKESDVIAFHVHLNKETYHLLNSKNISKLKKNAVIINTSRGEVVDEKAIINFLKKNKSAKYACDVIENELKKKSESKLIKFSKKTNQIIISPHIGGMTLEAQQIAYHRIADKLNYIVQYGKII